MQPLTDSKIIEHFFRDAWEEAEIELSEQELVFCAYLNRQGKRIFHKQICQCRYSRTLIDFRAIIKHALNVQSHYVILAHNHPCGDHLPSEGDKIETERLLKFLAIADIELVEHIILTENKCFSFRDAGLIDQMKKTG